MNWTSVKDQKPPKKSIIVYCNSCKKVHMVTWDFNEYVTSVLHDQTGQYGMQVNAEDFDYWMPLPEPPKMEKDAN